MLNFWQKRKIYLSITTTPRSDWRDKIEETERFGLTEVCLFPTFLKKPEREELYRLLENSPVKKIPLVHLREEDMETEEIDYLAKRFQVETFNLHSPLGSDFQEKLGKYARNIYIENHPFVSLNEDELKKVAGICIDFSHLEDARLLKPKVYAENIELIEYCPSGCSHISAIAKEPRINPPSTVLQHNAHFLEALSEMDYLKNYPAKFFPPVIAIELENSLKEQLKIRDYIVKLLEKR